MKFLLRLFFCFLFLLIWTRSEAQQVLWANKVLGFSSEYRPENYGHAYRARQILGEPNKLPAFGNSPCAWSPADADGRGEEWIKVGFEKSIRVSQIAIAENFNPGAIARVYGYDAAGKEYLVLDQAAAQTALTGRMLRIFPEQKELNINAVKIVMQPSKVSGFNQIDAIGISENTVPIEAKINLVKGPALKNKRENMGSAINTSGQEVAPVVSPDGKTLFFTRKGYAGNIGRPDHQDIWVSTANDKGQWSTAANIGAPLNNRDHNAVVSISSDGKTIYLINAYRPDGSVYFGFSKSFKSKTGWTFPKESKISNLARGLTEREDTDLEIAVSPYENVLILSLQRADTEGSRDLYVSFLQKDETWSEPRNLGTVINSAEDEGTPYLALDNKTLYFSTAGRSGYGSADIFLSRRLDDTWMNWSTPENLGPMVNTPLWEAYINISASGDYAYFSASDQRPGQEDIFRIRLNSAALPDPVAVVSGYVYEAETTKSIQSDVIVDLKKDNSNFSKATFDPETGEYKLVLPLKEAYKLSASGDGYFSMTEDIDFSKDTTAQHIKRNLYLVPIKAGQQIRLNNTMFAQSSAEVNPSSYSELDKIVSAMTSYPKMEILLEGHTDNQGEVQKNVKLSADRVAQVKRYLLSKGIEGKRIQTKAWGPARPIASNLTEQTRQKNRRVEFTILKI